MFEDRKLYKAILDRFEDNHNLKERQYWKLAKGDNIRPEHIPLNAKELEQLALEFYSTLKNENVKLIFAKNFHNTIDEYFKATKLEPTEQGYDEYLSYLKKARTDKYWKVGDYIEFNNSVFETDLNEQFFRHIVAYFSAKKSLKQNTFFFLYYIFIHNEMIVKQELYVNYVNEKYNQKIKSINSTENLTIWTKAQKNRIAIFNEAKRLFEQSNTTIKIRLGNMDVQ